jgi:hypothetical protein
MSSVNHLLNERKEIQWINLEIENGLIIQSTLKKPIFNNIIPMEKSQFIGDHMETQLDLYMETILDFMKEKKEFNVIHIPSLDPWMKEFVLKLSTNRNVHSFPSFQKKKKNLWVGDTINILNWNQFLISFNHLDSHLLYQSMYLLNNAVVQLGYLSNLKNSSNSLPLFSLNYVKHVNHLGFGKIIKIDFEKKQFHIQTQESVVGVNVIQFYKKESLLNVSLLNNERGMNGFMIKKRSLLRGVQKY